MSESTTSSKKLQWKWVGITLLLYIIFYPSPIFLARSILAAKTADLFIGAWMFAGIVIIGAIAGYLSKEVTLWEPAIAGAGFIILFFLIVGGATLIITKSLPPGLTIFQSIVQAVIIIVVFFLMSLLGAWLGERAQKLWKGKTSEQV